MVNHIKITERNKDMLWSTKALGGIKVVINLISNDIILVDHLTLLLMGSTGRHLEVIIS